MEKIQWTKDEDFKILQLCDIHWSQSDLFEKHAALMQKTIDDAKPDLIVLNGDSFTFADKMVVARLFSFIDGQGIPWTFTFGNHDDQGYYPDNYIQRLLTDKTLFPNCKFINLEDDDVTGRSNFAINIYKNNLLKFQVYLFESHNYNFDSFGYDFIKQDQIDWYKRMVTWTNQTYVDPEWKPGDEAIPSAAYFHIPTPDFFEAWNAHLEGSGEAELLLGSTDEFGGGPAPSTDLHLIDVFREYGSTKAVSVAHDHVNDSVIKYKGIYYCFGVHATDRIYYDGKKLGGQVIVVDKDDQSLSFENIYHTYSELEGK